MSIWLMGETGSNLLLCSNIKKKLKISCCDIIIQLELIGVPIMSNLSLVILLDKNKWGQVRQFSPLKLSNNWITLYLANFKIILFLFFCCLHI